MITSKNSKISKHEDSERSGEGDAFKISLKDVFEVSGVEESGLKKKRTWCIFQRNKFCGQ